jgi:hypothetical protein
MAGKNETTIYYPAGKRFVWFFQFFDTVSEDDDPLFWSRHIESTLNLRSLLSVRQPNRTTLLILHLLSPRRINSDLANLFPGLLLHSFMPLIGKHPAEFDLALQALLQGRSRGIYIFRNGGKWFSQCTGLPESGWSPRDVATSAGKHGTEDLISRKMQTISRKESTAERMEVIDAVPLRAAQGENGLDSVPESSTDQTVWTVKQALEVPHQPDAILEDHIGTAVEENTNNDLKVPTRPCITPGQDLWPLILEICGRDPKLPTLDGLNHKQVKNHERNVKVSNWALRLKMKSQNPTSQSVKKYPKLHAASTSQAYTIRSSSRGVLCRNRGGHLMRVVKLSSQSDDNLTIKEGTGKERRGLTETAIDDSIRDRSDHLRKAFGRSSRRSDFGRSPRHSGASGD